MLGISRFLRLDNYTAKLPFEDEDKNSNLLSSALWVINHLMEENNKEVIQFFH